ncbi:biotin synthase BioB [Allokutzneria albata]|uniref:Biotin synthase n=1 Tax=Allokutzneria albata TaxID=211114 RepID=A0A1G9UH09_ALLAB|nr:radical SAM protein [Allokutzneria albata]SDM58825.1 biotin synthase [Allokutzneria albata]
MSLTVAEITELLRARGEAQDQLFSEARRCRATAWGDVAVLRGVVEVTNLCRVNCDYCPMRRDNTVSNSIYVLDVEQIVARAREIHAAGIDVVFLQAGEIPKTTKIVGEAIPRIRELFNDNVEILLNLGNKKRSEYAYLKDQGATSYILKHETSDPALYAKLRHETFASRMRCMEDLLDLGYKVGTGAMVGLPGQSLESVAEDILLAKRLGVHMSSIAPFIPAPGTPLADHAYGDVDVALNAIAAMRIVEPTWLIPSVSALAKTRGDGQLRGFQAGANVMTINFSDPEHAGKYLIYGKDRFVVRREHATRALTGAGMTVTGSLFLRELTGTGA